MASSLGHMMQDKNDETQFHLEENIVVHRSKIS